MDNNKNSFDWKQYICDIKALTGSITNGTATDDMLEKLKWENMADNYTEKNTFENIIGDIDLQKKLEKLKEVTEPMKELIYATSRCNDDSIKNHVIKIYGSYCLFICELTRDCETHENIMVYTQLMEPFSELINKLVHELQLKYPVKQQEYKINETENE